MADTELVAAEPGEEYPNHEIEWGVTPASTLLRGERRLEASTYLTDGYGRRQSIEARPTGWAPIGEAARVWQPSRLKGVVLPEGAGTPFLSAGQVYERHPTPRKWLSPEKTPDFQGRFVSPRTLLVTCSGSVGRVTVAHAPQAGRLITHDLLRIEPHSAGLRGWVYAFMRTAAFRSMAVSSHYGHMIKHLEPGHVEALPIVVPPAHTTDAAQVDFDRIFSARDQAWNLIHDAYDAYSDALTLGVEPGPIDTPFVVPAAELVGSRRRLDAYHHNLGVQHAELAMRTNAIRIDSLPSVTRRVWWPNRFRRVFGKNGVPYVSAEELFDLNPPVTKRIHEGLIADAHNYHVEPGWLLMARSGQIYGLNGRVVMASQRHSEYFVSEDIIRVIPDEQAIRPGYLEVALGHPTLGRPLVVRHAYGTSIPHLEPKDLGLIRVPRLDPSLEASIAALVEQAAALRSEADLLEDAITDHAESVIQEFTRGAGAVG